MEVPSQSMLTHPTGPEACWHVRHARKRNEASVALRMEGGVGWGGGSLHRVEQLREGARHPGVVFPGEQVSDGDGDGGHLSEGHQHRDQHG